MSYPMGLAREARIDAVTRIINDRNRDDAHSVAAAVVDVLFPPPRPVDGFGEEYVVGDFDVILEHVSDNRDSYSHRSNWIKVIKVLRELTPMSLKDAKYCVDSLPNTVLYGVTEDVAQQARNQLVAAGGNVKITVHA